jgi:hypothetical protein
MKSVTILMVAAAVLAAPRAHSASVVLKAHIPFDFVVADQQLPSGEYQIVQDHSLVKIYSQSGEQLAIAHWLPQTAAGNVSSSLVFHRCGSQRFLRVIGNGDGSGAYLPETRSERGARTGGASATVVATPMS